MATVDAQVPLPAAGVAERADGVRDEMARAGGGEEGTDFYLRSVTQQARSWQNIRRESEGTALPRVVVPRAKRQRRGDARCRCSRRRPRRSRFAAAEKFKQRAAVRGVNVDDAAGDDGAGRAADGRGERGGTKKAEALWVPLPRCAPL